MTKSLSTAMLDEIKEQPQLLAGLFARRASLTAEFVRMYRANRIKRIFFVGNGSPYYAGCTLSGAAVKLLHVDAEAVTAGYFNHHIGFSVPGCYRPEEVLLVCPAESGRSRGQVDAARRARALGIPVVSTTLNPDGLLARTSDVVLPKSGSHEAAMAATKGQTMALLLLLMCFLDAAADTGAISEQSYQRYLSACEALPRHVEKSISLAQDWFSDNEARIMAAEQFFILGYGANFGTAQESALKFYECHQRPTLALEMEDSLHGPFRALHKTDAIFLLCAEDGPERDRMHTLADALSPYCDNRILVQREDRAAGDPGSLPVCTDDVEFVNAIGYLVPMQVLSYLISANLGIDLTIPLVSGLDSVMLPAYEDSDGDSENG